MACYTLSNRFLSTVWRRARVTRAVTCTATSVHPVLPHTKQHMPRSPASAGAAAAFAQQRRRHLHTRTYFSDPKSFVAGDAPPIDVAGKRCAIIYTGGTAGMRQGADGSLECVHGYLPEQIEAVLATQDGMPECDVLEWPELFDSSNMEPASWVQLAKDVERLYWDYDGFVIVHGTDTMAFTASALSFMLQDLNKPVILTGSMIPWSHPYTDARRNIIVSILLACSLELSEVGLYFGERLYRGNRAVKRSLDSTQCFHSPNHPALGKLGPRFTFRPDLVLPPPKAKLKVHTNLNTKLNVIRLTPGFDDFGIRLITENMDENSALVLMLYGTGGAPSRKGDLYAAVRQATDRGSLVIIASQCPHGAVDLGMYKASSPWKDAGAVGAGDMTIEAVAAKASYLLGLEGLSIDQVRAAFMKNLRGERTNTQLLPAFTKPMLL